jgi:hypothetical protein
MAGTKVGKSPSAAEGLSYYRSSPEEFASGKRRKPSNGFLMDMTVLTIFKCFSLDRLQIPL